MISVVEFKSGFENCLIIYITRCFFIQVQPMPSFSIYSNYQYSFCFSYWNILHDAGILTLDRIKSEKTKPSIQDTWLIPYSTAQRDVVQAQLEERIQNSSLNLGLEGQTVLVSTRVTPDRIFLFVFISEWSQRNFFFSECYPPQ